MSYQLQSVRKMSSFEESKSDVPSFYDRYIFPQPPELISEDEHNSMLLLAINTLYF